MCSMHLELFPFYDRSHLWFKIAVSADPVLVMVRGPLRCKKKLVQKI